MSAGLELFSTCPQSRDLPADQYRRRVADVAAWSDRAGYRGVLVYTDNQLVDPWLVAQLVIESTRTAVPAGGGSACLHAPLHRRQHGVVLRPHLRPADLLNMVAGGFRNDLLALGDQTEHAERYARVVEYALLVKRLLLGERVSFTGRYYSVENLTLTPPPPDLFPGIFVSGSSDSGVAAARAIGATAVKYPKPPHEEISTSGDGAGIGMRVGIIARDDDSRAWKVARARFPEDRKGQISHALAMKVSDSQWHRQLSATRCRTTLGGESRTGSAPSRTTRPSVPTSSGATRRSRSSLRATSELGFETFILDIPPDEEELEHAAVAFEQASRRAST